MPKFGIEIECFNLSTIPTQILDLGWVEHGDGSIRGRDSAEIVSPPLVACNESYAQVKQVMKLIREAGGRVNSSCGMHVHVEVENSVVQDCYIGQFFNCLVARYADLEPYFDTLVPPSRRANQNGYCASVGTISYDVSEEILGQNNVNRIKDILCDYDRYFKLNLAAYPRHGTVEFRHFGGTLNGTKAVSWIRLCVAFMEAAKRHTLRNGTALTSEQWMNPYYLLDSRKAIAYLTARHNETVNPTPRVVQDENQESVSA